MVSPYGELNWIKNARAIGKVKSTRAGKTTDWTLEELLPESSAPVLKKYLDQEQIVLPYFQVQAKANLEEFEKIAPEHPVFLLRDMNQRE